MSVSDQFLKRLYECWFRTLLSSRVNPSSTIPSFYLFISANKRPRSLFAKPSMGQLLRVASKFDHKQLFKRCHKSYNTSFN